MKRWHEEKSVMKKQLKVQQQFMHSDNKWTKQAGRYRKKHALDCGNPQCGICHSSKVFGISTHKENVNNLSFREQLREAI